MGDAGATVRTGTMLLGEFAVPLQLRLCLMHSTDFQTHPVEDCSADWALGSRSGLLLVLVYQLATCRFQAGCWEFQESLHSVHLQVCAPSAAPLTSRNSDCMPLHVRVRTGGLHNAHGIALGVVAVATTVYHALHHFSWLLC